MSDQQEQGQFAWLLKITTYLVLNIALLAVGMLLAVLTTGWMQSVGTSLLASAIVGLLFLYQLRIDRRFDDARRVYDDYGITSIIPVRSQRDLYVKDLRHCREQVDVIAESLSRFYGDLGQEYFPQLQSRGVRIRLLLLDPDSPFVASRQEEDLSPERTDLQAEIRKSAAAYSALRLTNLEVRFYRCTPTLNYLRIDGRLYVGSYFVGINSGRRPALVLRANERLAKDYSEHFENIWESFSRSAKIERGG